MHEKNNSPHYIIKLAQEMRRNLTPSEEILWHLFKSPPLGGWGAVEKWIMISLIKGVKEAGSSHNPLNTSPILSSPSFSTDPGHARLNLINPAPSGPNT